jgi:hypothetical protein
MRVKMNFNIDEEITNCNLQYLTILFIKIANKYFQEFISQAMILCYNQYLSDGQLLHLLNCEKIQRKSTTGTIKIKTLLGKIELPNIQIRVWNARDMKFRQLNISRILLGVERYAQIPGFMKKLLGMVGSLTSFRVGHKICCSLSNLNISMMSLWRSVGYLSKNTKIKPCKDAKNEAEADGTGIPTRNSGKRGSELKVVFRRTKLGKLYLSGISIGKYKDIENWKAAFKTVFWDLKEIILASDCDGSLIKAAKIIKGNIIIQRDLWHVFHQLKYYLWQDKATKAQRNNLIKLVYRILMLKTEFTSKKRLDIIGTIIQTLRNNNFTHTATYLSTATEGFFTYEKYSNSNKYTSKTERSMRTINSRINIGKWSDEGALNVCKNRLLYYYNGVNPFEWKKAS